MGISMKNNTLLGFIIAMGICLTACNSAEVDDITNSSTDVVSSIEVVSDVSATEDSISIDSSNVSSSEEVVENEEVGEEEELGEKLSFLDSPTSPIIISKTESVYTEDGTLVFSNTYEYYDDGKLKTVTADDGTTKYTYDDHGNIASKTYNSDAICEYTNKYDTLGNLISKEYEDQGIHYFVEYEYDSDGNCIKETDTLDDGSDSSVYVIESEYREDGTLSLRTGYYNDQLNYEYRYNWYGDQVYAKNYNLYDSSKYTITETEYTYDEYGNIIEAKDDTAVITYEYDEYGNVVKQTMSYGEYVVTEYQYQK